MSVSDEDPGLPPEPDFTEEVEISDLSRDKISNIFSWEEGEAESSLEPDKPSFSAPAEKPPEKPEGKGFLATLERINPLREVIRRRRAREEELSLGIDLSKPRREDEELDPPSAFQELLKPLSGSELVLLQKDVQADDTVYARINKARANANIRQRWAIFITSIFALAYLWLLGPSYLTEILPGADTGWLPEALSQDIREKIVFVLGLILPFFSLLVLSEGIRLLLVGLLDQVRMALVRGLVTTILMAIALVSLLSGGVFLAGLSLILWLIFRKLIEHPLLRKIQSRREDD